MNNNFKKILTIATIYILLGAIPGKIYIALIGFPIGLGLTHQNGTVYPKFGGIYTLLLLHILIPNQEGYFKIVFGMGSRLYNKAYAMENDNEEKKSQNTYNTSTHKKQNKTQKCHYASNGGGTEKPISEGYKHNQTIPPLKTSKSNPLFRKVLGGGVSGGIKSAASQMVLNPTSPISKAKVAQGVAFGMGGEILNQALGDPKSQLKETIKEDFIGK